MNKAELVAAVAEKSGTTKLAAGKVVDATLNVIAGCLNQGEAVQLVGFGGFQVIDRAPRKGRNPTTGRIIDIPARKSVRFRPGNGLADVSGSGQGA